MSLSNTKLNAALACVLVLALASFTVACGDSESDGNGATSSADTSATTDATSPTEPEKGDGGTTETERAGGESADDGAGSGGGDDGGDSPADGETAASPEDEVAEIVTQMYRDFANGNAAGVCAVMTEAARKQVVRSSQDSSSCEEAFGRVLAAATRGGSFKGVAGARVGDVEIDGSVAQATVILAGRGGKVRLVKEEGEWRFGAPGVAPAP